VETEFDEGNGKAASFIDQLQLSRGLFAGKLLKYCELSIISEEILNSEPQYFNIIYILLDNIQIYDMILLIYRICTKTFYTLKGSEP
jgi:hypothetical protein